MAKRAPSEGFSPPDLTSAVDVQAQIDRCPEGNGTRGMFLQEILDAAKDAGRPLPGAKKYTAWRMYPMREYVRVIAEGCALVFPDKPLREAMYLVGKNVYPNFAQSMIGRTIFRAAGKDFRRVASLAPRAYKHSIEGGLVEVTRAEDGYVHVALTDLWTFPSSFHVGVWHGGMVACDIEGDVYVKTIDDANAEIELLWDA